jgi:aminoglycoside N3'-acetyltransferase
MSEREAIDRAETPATVDSLVRDLSPLGPRPGMTVLVHTSLPALG